MDPGSYFRLLILMGLAILKGLQASGDTRPMDCQALLTNGIKRNGEYTIYPDGSNPVKVYCDMVTDGGGWTVIQRRRDGSTDFYRGWEEYKKGFGDKNYNFWLGLDAIHTLTLNSRVLRFDVVDVEENQGFATYSNFQVSSGVTNYTLTVSGYSGNAGDSFSQNNGIRFSTKDRLNGISFNDGIACGLYMKGAWWYGGGCGYSNLNGLFTTGAGGPPQMMTWWHFLEARYWGNIKYSEMKVRRNITILNAQAPVDVCSNSQTLADGQRLNTYSDGKESQCDSGLSGWYRFGGSAGTRMLNSCPYPRDQRSYLCGSRWQGWLNDSSEIFKYEGEVSRKVCFSTVGSCNCAFQKTVNVKNCGGNYVYWLSGAPSCNLRYCGEMQSCTCPTGTTEYNGKCYRKNLRRNYNWDQARSKCLDYGADLVVVDNAGEYNFLKDTIRVSNHWMGLTDKATEGTFIWVDGKTLANTGTHWSSGEPNHGSSEDCVRALSSGWSDVICSSNIGLVCEQKKCMTYCSSNSTNFCSPNAVCIDKNNGSYDCLCKTGYNGDGFTCKDSRDCSIPSNVCSSNGYCANTNGIHSCKCKEGYFGDGVTCTGGTTRVVCDQRWMKIYMDPRTQLYNGTSITLRDPTCTAIKSKSENEYSLLTSLDRCGTTKKETSTHIVYENDVIWTFGSPSSGGITRSSGKKISFSCSFDRLSEKSVSHHTLLQTFVHTSDAGFGNFTISFTVQNDSSFATPFKTFPAAVTLDQRLYFELNVGTNDTDIILLTEKVSATPTTDKNHPNSYTIIANRCPADPTAQFHPIQDAHKTRFSFKAFRFLGLSNNVYLHFQMFMCHKNSSDSRCTTGCQGNNVRRQRRSLYEIDQLSGVDKAVRSLKKREVKDVPKYPPSKTYDITLGPFVSAEQKQNPGKGTPESKSSFTAIHGILLTTSVLCVALMFFVVKALRKKCTKTTKTIIANDKKDSGISNDTFEL